MKQSRCLRQSLTIEIITSIQLLAFYIAAPRALVFLNMTMDDLQRIQIRGDYSLEDLPRSTPIYLYTGAEQCNQVFASEFDRFQKANRALVQEYHEGRQPDLHDQSRDLTDYILFRFINASTRDEYLNDSDLRLSTLSGDLILLTMVPFEHGVTPALFDKGIYEALRPIGLHNAIETFSRTTIKAPGGETSKQADEAWGPEKPPHGYSRNKPSLVLEVGVSESCEKLRRDVEFWLDPERGQANMVLTCMMDRRMPTIIIDTWELSGPKEIRRTQHIVLSKENKDGEKISKTHDSLTIPFSRLFRREPEGTSEKNLVLDKERLELIVRRIWEVQGFWEVEFL